MNLSATIGDYGVLTEPATLRIERLLPGSIDRVWAYLTESDLRRKWLASGLMDMAVGAPVELVWRNSELTDPPGYPPEGFSDEHRRTETITELDPPHRLSISWGSTGGVTFTLDEQGDEVLLTIVHKRIEDPEVLLNVSAGWHAPLDVLEARARETPAAPHWDNWTRLREVYAERLFG